MILRSLLFVFPLLFTLDHTHCFFKNPKGTLDNYVIDLLFANCLTIIRCNPHELDVIRDMTIQKVGYIKCSNRKEFLPADHVKNLSLLSWQSTVVTCDKKNNTVKEKTYLHVINLAKDAFKKKALGLKRVGSTESSELKVAKPLEYVFQHPRRIQLPADTGHENRSLPTEFYQIKDRPILCRERQLSLANPCSPAKNFSYVCYYRFGVVEPPTIADMDRELRTLTNGTYSDETAIHDRYVDKTPQERPSTEFPLNLVAGIGAVVVVTIISIIMCCCCSCCRRPSRRRMPPRRPAHVDSNSSIATNIS